MADGEEYRGKGAKDQRIKEEKIKGAEGVRIKEAKE
jgi:hypothetical protein